MAREQAARGHEANAAAVGRWLAHRAASVATKSGEGEAPTCGHPGNEADGDHPGDGGGSGSEGSYYTPGGTGHPGDDEGENGVTPDCGGDTLQADDPFGI